MQGLAIKFDPLDWVEPLNPKLPTSVSLIIQWTGVNKTYRLISPVFSGHVRQWHYIKFVWIIRPKMPVLSIV